MKRQKFRMKLTALLLVCLFLLLALGGVRSLSTYGSRWFSYSGNPRLSARKQDTVMGDILDRRGVLLASTEEGKRVYASSPSVRSALVHLLGDRGGRIENGVESFHAAYLYGWSSSLADAVRRLTRPREARKGNSITLTVDADLCSRIPGWFESHPLSAGRSGAAVVMNYLTGEIAAMVSLPVFDPDQEDGALPAGSDSAFRNRAVQALLPPGSAFQIVVSAAALENLPGVSDRSFVCEGSLPVSDSFRVQEAREGGHGSLRLDQAFFSSCDVVYASLALEMGFPALRKAAEAFGFNRNFLFRDLVVTNSVCPSGAQSRESLAALGSGQGGLLLSPLHLCLISAAVAGDGVAPEPRLLKKVVSPEGGTVLSFSSAPAFSVCSAAAAGQLSRMMKESVQSSGSGSQAAVTTLDIRGKAGTAGAEEKEEKTVYGWFTGFNAQKDLPFAVTVLVEDLPEGETGENSAALIARDIFSWLKQHPEIASP